MALNYSKKVMRQFLKPKNFGKIKNPDAIGKVGNPVCGDIMEMYLRVNKKTNKIKQIKFQTYGCAAAIASTSILTKLAKGKTLDQAEKITMHDVKDALKDLPKIKKHDFLLMKYLGKNFPTHGANYVGNGLILHHQINCYSRIEPYNGIFLERTVGVLRHESLL